MADKATQPALPRPRLRLNPLVLAGIGLLLAGIIMLAVAVGLPRMSDGNSPVMGTLSAAIQLAQRGILWGDRTLSDTQLHFNSVVVSVLLEGLTPSQRELVGTLSSWTRSLIGDVFSPLGLLTLLGLLLGYFALRRHLAARYPGLVR